MSPVSRGRKAKRKKASDRRTARPSASVAPDVCDCPSCTGADLDPGQLIDGLLKVAGDLDESTDPLEAEVVGASFLSIGTPGDEGFAEAVIDLFIPEFEARASSAALAMLLAIGSFAEGPGRLAASAAADRLVRGGVPLPVWAAELRAPVTVGECLRLRDNRNTASMLVGTFHREDRSHAVMIGVDHENCGAADEIFLVDADRLPGALERIRATGRADGLEIMTDAVDPAEFRCVVEQALDARAVHDDELLDEGLEASSDEEEVLGYPALALLVRARLDTLPATTRDSLSHGGALSPAETLAQLAGFAAGLPGLGRSRVVTGGTAVADLPPKRRESDPPAPVFQIKVGLRGAKPPIWRRLEVPGDIALAGFHTVIQIAFGWHDSHLHVFETPFGNFGTADPDLGHRSDAGVTLEQVAPDVGSKLRYTYDFGDDWGHDILIEKMLESSGTAPLPRCTGGRRAAPPDDCGGIWGYAELVEVLSDPADREHQDRLDWLGLEDAADFDPVAFDAGAVTRSLSRVS